MSGGGGGMPRSKPKPMKKNPERKTEMKTFSRADSERLRAELASGGAAEETLLLSSSSSSSPSLSPAASPSSPSRRLRALAGPGSATSQERIRQAESSIARARGVIDEMSQLIHDELSRLKREGGGTAGAPLENWTERDSQQTFVRLPNGTLVPASKTQMKRPRGVIRNLAGRQGPVVVNNMVFDPVRKQWRGNDDALSSFSPSSPPAGALGGGDGGGGGSGGRATRDASGLARRISVTGLHTITPDSEEFKDKMQGAPRNSKMEYSEERGQWISLAGGDGDFDEFDLEVDSPNDSSTFEDGGTTSDAGGTRTPASLGTAFAGLGDMNRAAMEAAQGSGMRYDRDKMCWVRDTAGDGGDGGDGDGSDSSDPFPSSSDDENAHKGDFVAVGEFDVDDATIARWRAAEDEHREQLGGWFAPRLAPVSGSSAPAADPNDERALLGALRQLALKRLVAQAIVYRAGENGTRALMGDEFVLSDSESDANLCSETDTTVSVDEWDDGEFGGTVLDTGSMLAKLKLQQANQHGSEMSDVGSDVGSGGSDENSSASVGRAAFTGSSKRRLKVHVASVHALEGLETGFEDAPAMSPVLPAKHDRERDTPQSMDKRKSLDAWREEPTSGGSKEQKRALRRKASLRDKTGAERSPTTTGATRVGVITPDMYAVKVDSSASSPLAAPAGQPPALTTLAEDGSSSDEHGFTSSDSEGAAAATGTGAKGPAVAAKVDLGKWGDSDSDDDDGFGGDAIRPRTGSAPAKTTTVPKAAGTGRGLITPEMMAKMSAGGPGGTQPSAGGGRGMITPEMMAKMTAGGSPAGGARPFAKPGMKLPLSAGGGSAGGDDDSDDPFGSSSDDPFGDSDGETEEPQTPEVRRTERKIDVAVDNSDDEDWGDLDLTKSKLGNITKPKGEMPSPGNLEKIDIGTVSKELVTTDTTSNDEVVDVVDWPDIDATVPKADLKVRLDKAKTTEYPAGSPESGRLVAKDESSDEDWGDVDVGGLQQQVQRQASKEV